MDTHSWPELSTLHKKLCLVNLAILFFFCINVRRGVCNTESDGLLQKETYSGGTHQTSPSDQPGSQERSLNRQHIERLLESFQSGDTHNLKYSHLGSTLQELGVSVEKLVEISEKTYLNDLANCQQQSRKKRDAGVEEQSEEDQQGFDKDKVAFSWGNFVLGGLFAVYRPDNGKPCQKLYNVTALWLESMIYAVNKINKDPDILPGIKLGYEIRDDCSDNNKVLQAGLQFVDSMSANGSCEDISRTIGVVGTGSSVTSATVTKLLALFEVPQVSYSASSPIFSNKQEYPYFLRTVGPDNYQAKVLVDIAKRYRWNYVAVIYSDDQYGSPGQDALSELFKQEGVCAVVTHRVSEEMADDEMRAVMKGIKADEKIQAIFTFISKSDIPVVLDAAEVEDMKDRTWIATDSWGDSLTTITKYKDVVTGMLWVSPRAIVDEGFKEYLQNLNPLTYTDNPWYRESLDALGCHLLDTENYSCPHSEPYLKLLDSASEGPVTSLVIDAVYSLAHGLHDMLGRCTGDDCWNSSNLSDYLEYVQNVSFSGFTNDPFLFDDNGDPFTQYSVFNLQNISGGGEVLFEEVGFWRHDSGLNLTKCVVWSEGGAAPVSRCSEDCSPGHHIILESPVTCCWKCVPCNENEISKETNSARCSACNKDEFVNANKTECLPKEVLIQSWTQPANVLILVFSLIGILCSISCFFIYVLYRETPVVKATSMELSLICLVGVICIFVTAPLFVTEPEDVVCQAQILLVGVGFSVVMAALLMKTNRISRIFNRKLSDGRPSMLLQIKYQILFVISLILAQISLGLINLMVYPSIAKYNYSTEKTVFKECTVENASGVWFSLVVTIGYNLILGMICNYQAFRIRKLPGQFNDSKSIFFTIFTLIIVYFVLVVIALSTAGSVTMTGTAVSMLFGGYSSLSLLFGRKIWVVLFRPKHNVPQSTFDAVLKNTASTLSPAVTTTDSQLEINGNTCNGLETNKETTDEEEEDIFDSGNYSEVSTLEDDEDLEEFLEEVAKLEEEIQSAQRERHASIRELNQVKEELRELEETHGKDLERMKDLCRKERQSVIEVLESAGYSSEEIQAKIEEVAEQKSRNNSSTDQSDQSPQEKYDAFHTEWKKRNTESENCLSGLHKMQDALFPNGFNDVKENGVHKQENITNPATSVSNSTNSS